MTVGVANLVIGNLDSQKDAWSVRRRSGVFCRRSDSGRTTHRTRMGVAQVPIRRAAPIGRMRCSQHELPHSPDGWSQRVRSPADAAERLFEVMARLSPGVPWCTFALDGGNLSPVGDRRKGSVDGRDHWYFGRRRTDSAEVLRMMGWQKRLKVTSPQGRPARQSLLCSRSPKPHHTQTLGVSFDMHPEKYWAWPRLLGADAGNWVRRCLGARSDSARDRAPER